MRAKAKESALARLARLEAAAASLWTPQSDQVVPAVHARMFQQLAAEQAKPGALLPSARALHSVFAACCQGFPESGDADLADPGIASLIPALREELTAFLQAHLDDGRGDWHHSTAWMDMADAGLPNPYRGARVRGPTAEDWCAGLSDLETVYDAADCLAPAAIRAEHWWEMRDSSCTAVREAVRLPAEEEAALLAEMPG